MARVIIVVEGVRFESGGPRKGPLLLKDREYDFTTDHTDRWVRRGVAEITDPDVAVKTNSYEPVPLTGKAAKAAAAANEGAGEDAAGAAGGSASNGAGDVVEIPETWRELKWFELQALVRKLGGKPVDKEAAVAAVEAAIGARAAD